jgi:hypothetical protein
MELNVVRRAVEQGKAVDGERVGGRVGVGSKTIKGFSRFEQRTTANATQLVEVAGDDDVATAKGLVHVEDDSEPRVDDLKHLAADERHFVDYDELDVSEFAL